MLMSEKFSSSRGEPAPSLVIPFGIRMLGVAGGLFALTTSASAATVGPLTELTASPVGEEMRRPAISYDSTEDQYVIVWEDYRNESTNASDLFVTRLTPNLAADPTGGTFIIEDADGLPLLTSPTDLAATQRSPSIVYSPTAGEHIIVWVDNRDGDQDIRMRRFFADLGTFSFDEEVSNQSATNDAEQENNPAVAYAVDGYLVTYERAIPGSAQVEGRRVFDQLTFRDTAGPIVLDPGNGARTPAVAAIGSTFFVAWSTDVGDIEARSVPSSGAIPAPTATVLGVAGNSKILPGLAPTGSGQLFAVWEESTATGRDVYGDRLATSLTSLGPQGGVSTATETQRDPKIAGDELGSGSFAIWQDFRINQRGAIFGATIDGNGNTVQEDGILLIARPQDVAEHAVVKGPNDDYLVAAVEISQTTAPRVWFRLVRDEEPDGMMTTSDPTMVAADGVTPAAICLGPAQGASGLPVVDRTRYTLSWASSAINPGELTIEPDDVDPVAPDHQLYSEDGEVCFQMTTTRRGVVDVTVMSDVGSSMGTVQITFENVPPVASNGLVQGRVSMNDTPRSRDDILLTYDYFDINDDPQVFSGPGSTAIRWERNDAVVPLVANSTVVRAANLREDDRWQAVIFPGDGTDQGRELRTNEVVIQNSPPELLNDPLVCEVATNACNNRPEFDLRTGEAIRSDWRVLYDDPDSDPIDDDLTVLRWLLNGAEQPELGGLETVSGDRVRKGQRWQFGVLPHDGDEFAEREYLSAEVVVNNTPPAFEFATNTVESAERQVVQLDASAATDLDEDDLTFRWEQAESDAFQITFDDPTSATPSFETPSVRNTAFLNLEVFISDGDVEVSDTLVVRVISLPDADGDFIDDELEMQIGTNPNSTDTDGDGIRDEVEVDPVTGEFIIDPLDADSDDDGVRDGSEGRPAFGQASGDPLGDPDGDGLPNVLDPDSDNDGILDGVEARRTEPAPGGGTEPYTYEGTDVSAGNFQADADPQTETNPIDPDTDGDGIPDGEEDANQNGRVDPGETDPNQFNCTQNSQCGSGEVCDVATGQCVEDTGTGNQCDVTLASQGLECCQDDNTQVEPVCLSGATTESCPTGSRAFTVGRCSGGGGGDEGGGCAATNPGSTAPLALLGLGWAALFVRRRRRS